MRDPHVVYLRYRLLPGNDATEFRAKPLDFERETFAVHVGPAGEGIKVPFVAVSASPVDDDGEATRLRVRRDIEALVTLKTHHPSERSAHEAVRPFLEAWELDAALKQPGSPPSFRFQFAGSLLIDRDPPAGEEAQYAVSGEGSLYVRPPDETVVYGDFPEPPPVSFAVDQHARTVWRRWEAYLAGQDTLGAAAYACLTYIETSVAQGEREAAKRLRVSRSVLENVRRLTSTVGDEATARKFQQTQPRPHTVGEVAFIEAAVTTLIRRLAEIAAVEDSSELAMLGMSNLPRPE